MQPSGPRGPGCCGLRSGQTLDAAGLGGSQSARSQPARNPQCPQPLVASLPGSSCGMWPQQLWGRSLEDPKACGVFPDQGSNQ